MNFSKKLITILGPTAVGKTKFSAQLAYRFNGEIISADSRQVYIGMDIGSGKDYDDYIVNKQKIKAHLVDIVKPQCEFNLYLFTRLFQKSLIEIQKENKLPFLVGGTGLYLSSIIQQYSISEIDFKSKRAEELEILDAEALRKVLLNLNPNLHNTTDLHDKKRIINAILVAENSNTVEKKDEMDFLIIGLNIEREILKEKIRARLKDRLKNGMIQEAELLINSGVTHEKLRFFGLEYKFLSMYLLGEINYNDMYQKLASAIIQFSKRQMTWFRKMEKEGVKIHWLNNRQTEKAEQLIISFLK